MRATPFSPHFSLELEAASDLASDATRADALIKVTAPPSSRALDGAARWEILIMDRSLSMARQRKLDEAKRAMCAAIDALHDGTHLALIAGHHRAEVIYPSTGGLARVDAAVKAAAKQRVNHQLPEGGTAIGSWLSCADRLFAAQGTPGAVRHVVLYTDGKNEHETPAELDRVLTACADHFVCDVRGLGDDWDHAELLRVTEALHGSPAAVVTLSDLTDDFTRLMRQTQRTAVARTYLGLRLDRKFQLNFVRQTNPRQAELTGQHQDHDGEIHVPLGSWTPGESREYQVSLHVSPEQLKIGDETRAANITVHAERDDGTRHPCATAQPLVVLRHPTPGPGIMRPDSFTRVENQRELARVMQACAAAYLRTDLERADDALRDALELAEELKHTEHLELLRQMAVRGFDGRWRLRRDLSRGEVQRLGLESTHTGPVPSPLPDPPGEGRPIRRRCRKGHWTTASSDIRFCEQCAEPFEQALTDEHTGPSDATPAEGDPQDAL